MQGGCDTERSHRCLWLWPHLVSGHHCSSSLACSPMEMTVGGGGCPVVSGGLMASLCQSRGLGSIHGPHRAQCVSVSSGSNSHTPGLSLGGQGRWSSVARAGWRWPWGSPSVCVHWLTLSPEGRGPVSAAASLADCLSCCLLGLHLLQTVISLN